MASVATMKSTSPDWNNSTWRLRVSGDNAPITTNRCCALKRFNHDGTKEKGYFVCDVVNGQINRRFVEYKGT